MGSTKGVHTSGVVWLRNSYTLVGSGDPEGSVTADVGSVYHRTDGASGTSLYIKDTGTGNTGWTALGATAASSASSQRFAQLNIRGGSTTVDLIGSWTLTGSPGDGSSNTEAWVLHQTAASSAQTAGYIQSTAWARIGQNITWEGKFQSGADITNTRLWLGLTSDATGMDLDTIAAGDACAAFRYSSVAGDTGLVCVTNENGTQTTSAAINTISANQTWTLKIVTSASQVEFYLDGTLVKTHTTNLPGATRDLRVFNRVITQAAEAKQLYLSQFRISAD